MKCTGSTKVFREVINLIIKSTIYLCIMIKQPSFFIYILINHCALIFHTATPILRTLASPFTACHFLCFSSFKKKIIYNNIKLCNELILFKEHLSPSVLYVYLPYHPVKYQSLAHCFEVSLVAQNKPDKTGSSV